VFPPPCEFPVSRGGHLSLEIGVTPGLCVIDGHSEDLLGPRLGAFVYPAGKLEGLALYAGLGRIAEAGIWGVWRADSNEGSSAGGRALAFRLGIGVARDRDHHSGEWDDFAIGAAVGFAF
jgi:hypothetical protein